MKTEKQNIAIRGCTNGHGQYKPQINVIHMAVSSCLTTAAHFYIIIEDLKPFAVLLVISL